ncbi:alkaline phosphatase D family protein [Moritella viscosa]|uniref:Alkaline phosphatase n=1 Tax=Moritella viscosa TaxID=80854 RepID=A0ABY1HLF8_9GAMM|nr:alkaline phosphatase D family protein [Moritella viscosa]SGY92650.1 Alkaline phosphatase [Moritella viscosa]SGZ02503.1 Alkaline phosphatase [Moritella viscosa]SHO25295.1 Alkaline phosphatase [Moritella viscosa]
MKWNFTRRDFLATSAKGVGIAILSNGLVACTVEDDIERYNLVEIDSQFKHGVASGDPTQSAVIIWTRLSPEQENTSSNDVARVAWEVALDESFNQLVTTGETLTDESKDFTVKVDAMGLEANTRYYYRFTARDQVSMTGTTKTLPEGRVEQVKLAVFSCANYPAGHFNVYDLAAQQDDIDAVLHLGDYIYEYSRDGYASNNADALNRQVLPAGELLTLEDYRIRYGQYRSDAKLHGLHRKVPFITVWDDHEVANDTWKDGAENHNKGEGDFEVRKMAALQAYFEWLPIRPWFEGNNLEIYRSFQFGDLLDLHMLDTRVLARDKQLNHADYFFPNNDIIHNGLPERFDEIKFKGDAMNSNRTLLGKPQLSWLQNKLETSSSRWQLLGQQVLMGKLHLSASVVNKHLSFVQFIEINKLVELEARKQANDVTLKRREIAYLKLNQHKLTKENKALIKMPSIPLNLDAWDGYAYEREEILATAKASNSNLVVVAGDTHNAWGSDLKDEQGDAVGVEFATASVSSPGMEYYLQIAEVFQNEVQDAVVGLVESLRYTNLRDRGFMTLTFTEEQVRTDWRYVNTVLSGDYFEDTDKNYSALCHHDERQIIPVLAS